MHFLSSFRIILCIRNQKSGFWGVVDISASSQNHKHDKMFDFLGSVHWKCLFPGNLIFRQSFWPFPKFEMYGTNAHADPTICYAILSHSPIEPEFFELDEGVPTCNKQGGGNGGDFPPHNPTFFCWPLASLYWYQEVLKLHGFCITRRFYISRRSYGINRLINDISDRLINGTTRLIHSLTRLINGWRAQPGPWGRHEKGAGGRGVAAPGPRPGPPAID